MDSVEELKVKPSDATCRSDTIMYSEDDETDTEADEHTNLKIEERFEGSTSLETNLSLPQQERSSVGNIERHKCGECGKNYISLQKYLDHINKHTGAKPYVCEECNKQFETLPYLKNHQKLHSAERRFVCEVCGKAFKLKNNLQMHELTHSKEKPYKCEVCGKAYTHPTNLKIHKQEHSGVKPFQCEQCGKCFRTTNRLKMHQVSHTGEKKFSCPMCGKNFTNNTKVKRHQNLHCKVGKEKLAGKTQREGTQNSNPNNSFVVQNSDAGCNMFIVEVVNHVNNE